MTAPDRRRGRNSTLPVRDESLARTPLRTALARYQGPGSDLPVIPRRIRAPGTIPPDVLALVDARDGRCCVRCGRWREVIDHHHRRLKGMGGSTAPHTECACDIVSACPWWAAPGCHRQVHLHRLEAEAEGLIIPRSARFPFLYPVLVHGREDGSGVMAWPTCAGEWVSEAPDGAP